MKIKCPSCGSTDVIAEAEVVVRFRVDDVDNVEIISEWSDVIEDIDNEVVYDCECEECGELFEYDKAAKYRGGNDDD